MSRWIDAEWLKELYKPYESYNGKELAVPIGAILANIDDAPSIDIVRCKDCKHCKRKKGVFRGEPIFFYRCAEHSRDVESDDYCSYGEREGE